MYDTQPLVSDVGNTLQRCNSCSSEHQPQLELANQQRCLIFLLMGDGLNFFYVQQHQQNP